MKKIFNTEEKARKHLEYRRQCAYSRIEKCGDKVLSDASFIYKDKNDKWIVFIQIITEKIMNDFWKLQDHSFHYKILIPFSKEEKIVKKELKIKQLEKKYKTLDIEDYTINKDL
jgi:hypothetical protein